LSGQGKIEAKEAASVGTTTVHTDSAHSECMIDTDLFQGSLQKAKFKVEMQGIIRVPILVWSP